MQYRVNRKTGDRISVIGIGSAYIFETERSIAEEALRRAYAGGINYFDLAAGHWNAFPIFAKALRDVRKNVFYQIHFGADYTNGDYGWSLDLDTVKRSVGKMLDQLGTDYIDYGFIHCQDELSDWEKYKLNGIYDFLLRLKSEGTVRHLGLSSHTPKVINAIMNEVDIDMLMFSVNPAYDFGKGEYAYGEIDERALIYRRCEKEGTGISVMKPFSGGQLLDASTSPFGKALTVHQCLKYVLDKPGVLVALPGVKSIKEVEELLKYDTLSDDEKDYSVISSFEPVRTSGRCVYCNHCKPCPAGIDIGLVNKYYDLALAGDEMAVEHYRQLSVNADRCVSCGHCDLRCPFSVKQSERMLEIKTYMAAH